ncbi:hypothetical protein B484DRAFT_480226 [Ochromonadaceae sp. CCMP2298]|nr:hypothetical protein B484DRAFT_480226 [Ochromonadaceae sp. CCMP2298]
MSSPGGPPPEGPGGGGDPGKGKGKGGGHDRTTPESQERIAAARHRAQTIPDVAELIQVRNMLGSVVVSSNGFIAALEAATQALNTLDGFTLTGEWLAMVHGIFRELEGIMSIEARLREISPLAEAFWPAARAQYKNISHLRNFNIGKLKRDWSNQDYEAVEQDTAEAQHYVGPTRNLLPAPGIPAGHITTATAATAATATASSAASSQTSPANSSGTDPNSKRRRY